MILYTLWYFFLMTLLMNKFTSIVIPTCFQFIHNPQNLIPLQGYWSSSCSCYMLALAHPLCCSMMHEAHTNFWNKLWYILHPNIYVMEYCHRWLKFGYEIAYQVLVFATLYIYNTWRKKFTRNTISIEQEERIDALNTIFWCYVRLTIWTWEYPRIFHWIFSWSK